MKKKLKSAEAKTLSSATVIETPIVKPMAKRTTPRKIKNQPGTEANGNGNGNGRPGPNGQTNGHYEETFEQLDYRELLKVLNDVKDGNFSVRLPEDKTGISAKICDAMNHIISINEMLMEELGQAKNTIGKKGHLNHRVSLPRYAKGAWATGVDSINTLISDLVTPTI